MPSAGIKGNRGGQPGRSGRKPNAVRDDLTKLLNKSWPKAERIALIRKLSLLASEGDTKAAAILLAYAYGKPIEHHENTGEDGGPIETVVVYLPNNGRD